MRGVAYNCRRDCAYIYEFLISDLGLTSLLGLLHQIAMSFGELCAGGRPKCPGGVTLSVGLLSCEGGGGSDSGASFHYTGTSAL